MTTWYRIQAGNKPQNIKSRRAGIDAGSSFLHHIYMWWELFLWHYFDNCPKRVLTKC